MRRFINNLLLFFSFLLIYFVVIYCINNYRIRHSDPPIGDANILICGDSHPEKSIDPDLFYSAINISQTAEPYFITFWKLKYLTQKISHDTIVLGFSPHNISSFNDDKLYDEFWSSEMFNRIYAIHHLDELNNIRIDNWSFIKTLFMRMCLNPLEQHFDFIASFENSTGNKIDDFKAVIERNFYHEDNSLRSNSELAIASLDSIYNLCNKNNIELILVASPVHKNYSSRIPEPFNETFAEIKSYYSTREVRVLDLSDTINEDSMFLNSNHLNVKGEKAFTSSLIQMLFNLQGSN